jgi:MATE family multidrug resistance protein
VNQRNDNEFRPLLGLALPIILVNLGNQFRGVVDTAIAGRIDTLSLGGTGLGITLFMVGSMIGIGIVLGIDPILSQAFGANRPRQARRTLWAGIMTGLLMVLPAGGVVLGLYHSLEFLGIAPDLAAKTGEYIYARLPELIPLLVFVSIRSYLQAAHRVGPIVIAMIASNLLNIPGDWILAFGDEGLLKLGLPAMGIPAFGVRGLGWVSVAVTTMEVVIGLIVLRKIHPGKETAPLPRPDRRLVGRIFRLGTPLGFQLVTEVGMFACIGVLMGTLGKVAMAAHQVAMMIASFTFMVPLGVGMATCIRVGMAIGRGDTKGTREAGVAGIRLGAAFMVGMAIVMWVIPGTLARVLTSEEEVIPLAVILIRIAAAFQIFDGIQVVASGALRGAGMTRFLMITNFVAYWCIALPISWGLGIAGGRGPEGLWWGLTFGLAIAAAIMTTRFLQVSRRPIAAIPVSTR